MIDVDNITFLEQKIWASPAGSYSPSWGFRPKWQRHFVCECTSRLCYLFDIAAKMSKQINEIETLTLKKKPETKKEAYDG